MSCSTTFPSKGDAMRAQKKAQTKTLMHVNKYYCDLHNGWHIGKTHTTHNVFVRNLIRRTQNERLAGWAVGAMRGTLHRDLTDIKEAENE